MVGLGGARRALSVAWIPGAPGTRAADDDPTGQSRRAGNPCHPSELRDRNPLLNPRTLLRALRANLGMCGPLDSVIGVEKELVIEGFLSQRPLRFEVAQDDVVLQGILLDVDEDSGKAKNIRRIRVPWKRRGG